VPISLAVLAEFGDVAGGVRGRVAVDGEASRRPATLGPRPEQNGRAHSRSIINLRFCWRSGGRATPSWRMRANDGSCSASLAAGIAGGKPGQQHLPVAHGLGEMSRRASGWTTMLRVPWLRPTHRAGTARQTATTVSPAGGEAGDRSPAASAARRAGIGGGLDREDPSTMALSPLGAGRGKPSSQGLRRMLRPGSWAGRRRRYLQQRRGFSAFNGRN
jgi:hypothetical protein